MTLNMCTILWMPPLSPRDNCLSPGLCPAQPGKVTLGWSCCWVPLVPGATVPSPSTSSRNHGKLQIPASPQGPIPGEGNSSALRQQKTKIMFFMGKIQPISTNKSLVQGVLAPRHLGWH